MRLVTSMLAFGSISLGLVAMDEVVPGITLKTIDGKSVRLGVHEIGLLHSRHLNQAPVERWMRRGIEPYVDTSLEALQCMVGLSSIPTQEELLRAVDILEPVIVIGIAKALISLIVDRDTPVWHVIMARLSVLAAQDPRIPMPSSILVRTNHPWEDFVLHGENLVDALASMGKTIESAPLG